MSAPKSKLVLYHDRCVDGLSAAVAAHSRFGNLADYVGVSYGEEPPPVFGKETYVLDFCFPAEVTLRMAEEAASLTVLDHHKTAESDMRRIAHRLIDSKTAYIHFDMNKSGALLAAEHFGCPSWWYDYVSDRDLWTWKLPNSRTINAYIQSLPRTMEDYIAAQNCLDPDQAHVLGMGCEKYLQMYIREVASTAQRLSFGQYTQIPVVNAPFVGISELLHELARDALFSVGWCVRKDGKISVSLRSIGDFDVSALAQEYGGGGHKNAAGFRLATYADFPWYKT